ncbi:MAG: hypothetical protein ABEJ22_01395 [Haloferacaceae archaeon]
MSTARVSRWSRRSVAVGVCFLLAWQAVELAGVLPARAIVLGLLGFVWHVVFGKAYALVPSYFERSLEPTWPPAVQLPLTALGAVAVAAAGHPSVPAVVDTVGAAAWAAGVVVFAATLAWTVRTNPTGAETATGESNAHRRGLDRFANAFVPVAVAYLGLGSYELLAATTPLPALFGRGLPATLHLLGAGGAALLLFAIGFRLLPRFLVASPPKRLAFVVLPAGALGPALLAWSLGSGAVFRLGAVVETVAVVGFAVAFGALFRRSDRRRVGFYGVAAGVTSGVLAVLVGLHFAFSGITPPLVVAHRRLNVLGLLGLSVVGTTYQFYPPTVGNVPGADDRTALASLALLAGGLWVEAGGLAAGVARVPTVGRAVSLAGACLFAYLVFGAFSAR